MATYAIGDVQGCFAELQNLLQLIGFAPSRDKLWFCGDLVNRGPQSLATLRFIRDLGDAALAILGNHDMHLLALGAGVKRLKNKDTLDDILTAPDRDELLDWLRRQPLCHYDASLKVTLVHAGIPPCWTLGEAHQHAAEVAEQLRGSNYLALLNELYGDSPRLWQANLPEWERSRFIINALTRMRFLGTDDGLDLTSKGAPKATKPEQIPWFMRYRLPPGERLLFGHWAALRANCPVDGIEALDSGCVWGEYLTAYCVETGQRFQVPSQSRFLA